MFKLQGSQEMLSLIFTDFESSPSGKLFFILKILCDTFFEFLTSLFTRSLYLYSENQQKGGIRCIYKKIYTASTALDRKDVFTLLALHDNANTHSNIIVT